MSSTPSELKIKKGTIIPPVNGWKEKTYYVVRVALGSENVIHKSLFYSGFLQDSKPCGYNCLLNPVYDTKYKLTQTYYLQVIEQLSVDLK